MNMNRRSFFKMGVMLSGTNISLFAPTKLFSKKGGLPKPPSFSELKAGAGWRIAWAQTEREHQEGLASGEVGD